MGYIYCTVCAGYVPVFHVPQFRIEGNLVSSVTSAQGYISEKEFVVRTIIG